MNIKILIESIGLAADELKQYFDKEVEEFLKADTEKRQREEFADILFALRCMSYAHSKRHFDLNDTSYEEKVMDRLKKRGAISKKRIIFEHEAIQRIPIGVVHFAFGNFKQPWSHFDPLKNGTEAEVTLLTDIQYISENKYTNHLIITFDNVSNIEFSVISSGWKFAEKNTILCRVPDFLFANAKKHLAFKEAEEMLAAQTVAALSKVLISKDTIFHFHSWETGAILSLKEIKDIIGKNRKIFSPYLTVSRLSAFMSGKAGEDFTLKAEEVKTGTYYEKKLINFCDEVICESEIDSDYYKKIYGKKKIKTLSYVESARRTVRPKLGREVKKLNFVAGGRPVYEKGFLELCDSFAEVVKWGNKCNVDASLIILCKEYTRATGEPKRVNYIKQIEAKCKKLKIDKHVKIADKVSIGELKKIIKNSSGLIVPSLYDPFCLMPLYALDVNHISFVSKHAGISENIKSKEYVFDPYEKGDLLRSIKEGLGMNKTFVFDSKYDSYKSLYLKNKK